MADFLGMKYENPNLKQSEIANQLLFFVYFAKMQKRYEYAFTL